MKLNLHIHSTCSDGRKTPKEIALLMEANNITFALTDHDTTEGIQECFDALTNKDLLITGMEYSAKLPSHNVVLHILSYNFECDLLKSALDKYNNNQKVILKNVYKKLLSLNFEISLKDINNITRSDLADELVAKGYAEDELYAKRHIINKYVTDYGYLDIKEVISNVHNAKGKLFWAHPYQVLSKVGKFDISNEKIEEIVKELVEYGIDGLEVYYRYYTEEQVSFLKSLCDKYNLLFSTGTDIHFKNNDNYLNYDLDSEKALEIYKSIKE